MTSPSVRGLTRDEKIAEAVRRVCRGVPVSGVAGDLGVSDSTIRAWVWPERYGESLRRVYKRRWENEHDRSRCACGALMCVGAHRRGRKVCVECYWEMQAVGKAMRCERILEMWVDGWTTREIAEVLDSTPASIGTSVRRMRREGWDVPHRHRGYDR